MKALAYRPLSGRRAINSSGTTNAAAAAAALAVRPSTLLRMAGRGLNHIAARRSSTATSSSTRLIAAAAATKAEPYPPPTHEVRTEAPTDVIYDAVVVGGGMGGLTTAAKLLEAGAAKVLVLEKYLVPGGSAAHYKRAGYTFDVGSSMMFGMGDAGTTNLITKALESVGKRLETIPDPTQVHYHLPASGARPDGLNVQVWRKYEDFVNELTARFPHEAAGIRAFYGECWRVFDALNSLGALGAFYGGGGGREGGVAGFREGKGAVCACFCHPTNPLPNNKQPTLTPHQ
jgi:prolycopene isomerase